MALKLAGINSRIVGLEARTGLARLGRRLTPGDVARGAQRTDFDPLDPDVLADPYPSYRELLQGPALRYSRKRAVWIISRYDDVRAAARANDVLSSAEGVLRQRARLPMMLTMDRPDHARLRRMAARDFTRDTLERWRPAVERLARDSVDRMLAGNRSDAVAELASPLPVAVIAHVLGVPPADFPRFREWSDRIVEAPGVEAGLSSVRSGARVLGALIALRNYLEEQIARLRASPGDDVISRLIASSDEGTLTDEELFWFCLLLLVAGNETTTNLLGTMTLAFANHPDEYAKVRADTSLVPAAVEEALRHVSPIQGFYRTALADYQVGSATIPSGGRALLLYGAANRDPRHYPDPDRFLVKRNPTDHLAFGSGIHFCLGANLARIEGTVVLNELVRRVEAIELAGEPRWNGNPSLRGLSHLPVRLVHPSRPRPPGLP